MNLIPVLSNTGLPTSNTSVLDDKKEFQPINSAAYLKTEGWNEKMVLNQVWLEFIKFDKMQIVILP